MTEITNVRIKSNVHDACHRERDELREANKAQRNQIAVTNVELAECMTQRDELRAEVERQDKQWREIVTTVTTGNVVLEAEVKRLREERTKREADFEPLLDEILRLRAVAKVAREVQRGSETWYVPGDILDRLNSTLAALDQT